MDHTVVFDVVKSGYRQWRFLGHGLLFIAIGILLLVFRRRLPSGPTKFFPHLFLGFAIFWTTLTFLLTFCDYWSLSTALRGGRCQMVEGVVTDFDPMPESGHKNESFVVGGQRFAYSDYTATAGFDNTRSHGGPINNGVRVRVHYAGSEIARLEVAY